MLKNRKCIAAAIFATLLLNQAISQEMPFEHSPEPELSPENQLELENQQELEEQRKQILPPERQKNFIIVEPVRVHELNPQLTNYASDSQILNGLFEGLFTISPITLEPQYALATEFKISRDKKRWAITLRSDARFSNGEKITAESVRKSWLRMLENPASPYSSLFDIVRGAQAFRNGKGAIEDVGLYATDENVLSIYLNAPANYLPKILCHTAFSITHENPEVYSGAYELEISAPRKYVLKKNPYYWDKNNVIIERVSFLQSDNPDENTYYYNTGAVDWVCGRVNQNQILDTKAFQVNAEFGTGFLYFKTSNKKPMGFKTSALWDYPEFRAAVLEAFPWAIIRKNYMIPATTLVYPLSGYPQVEGFDFTDAIEASLKMKDARKKYKIPAEQIIPLVFYVFDNEFDKAEQEAIQNALLPLGIDVQIKGVPSSEYYATIDSADADILVTSWIGDFADPLAFLELFRGGSTMNTSGWHNKEFDRLIEQAAVANDSERYNLLAKAENILMDEAVVLPLYRIVTSNVIDVTEVGGWYVNAFDHHPLKFLYKKQSKLNSENIVKR